MTTPRHALRRSQRSRLATGFGLWGAAWAGASVCVAMMTAQQGPLVLAGALTGVTVIAGLALWVLCRRQAAAWERLPDAVIAGAETGHLPELANAPAEWSRLRDALTRQRHRFSDTERRLHDATAQLAARTEQHLSQEATLTAIYDNTPFDIWTTDEHGVYTYQNRFAREQFGDVIGVKVADLELPADVLAERSERTGRVLAGETVQKDLREDTALGTRYYHVLEAPIRRNGRVIGTLGVKIDLTEQRRAEEALRLSQRRISRHLENTPLGVVDFDEQFRIRSWNAAAAVIFGWQTHETIGRLGSIIVPPAERANVIVAWRKLMATPAGSRHFNQNITRDGRTIDCEWYNTPITDEEGRIVGVSSLVLDVTDRLAAERLFRESEERFQKVFHLSPIPQVIIGLPDGRIIDVNPSWLQAYGYQREEVIDRTGAELSRWVSIKDRQRFHQALAQDDAFPVQIMRLHDSHLAVRTVLLGAARARLGDRDCAVVSQADITDRIAAEDALRQSREFLATLVDQLPGMTFRCRIDRDWTMLWVNQASQALCGYAAEEFINQEIAFNELILPAERAAVTEVVEAARRKPHGQRRYSLEYRIKHRDGRTRWLWEQGEIVRNPETALDEIVGFITDITPRKLAERDLHELNETLELRVTARTAELAAANEKLQELDRLKTEFLATMSHELRTPLNSIIGFSSILHRGMVGPLSSEQHHQIGLVHQSAAHLLELINDLLDVSRIDSGRMEFVYEETDVAAVLRDVAAELAPTLDPTRLRYRTECDEGLPALVTDRRRLHQIVQNLAVNAVKFTPGPDGDVTVSARALPDDGIVVTVTDTGIGIKAEHLPQLFEAFRQIDGSARRVYDGVGLGLNLVRKLTAKLGGHIAVASEFGRGSRFTVTLPARAPGANLPVTPSS